MRKETDRKKTLQEAEIHLKGLKSRIGNSKYDQQLVKINIENTQSLINSIKNNELLIG
jgi:hypothetical protein